jgi:hypothetical protein
LDGWGMVRCRRIVFLLVYIPIHGYESCDRRRGIFCMRQAARTMLDYVANVAVQRPEPATASSSLRRWKRQLSRAGYSLDSRGKRAVGADRYRGRGERLGPGLAAPSAGLDDKNCGAI